AAMYDASLDDLAPAQNWQQQTQGLNLYYQPNYYSWNTANFVNEVLSIKLFHNSENFDLLIRDYEKLNLLGYSYFGYNSVYRSFLDIIQQRKHLEQQTKEDYLKSVAAFKNGFDIKGRVISADDQTALSYASVKIAGTEISTVTNIDGYFKLHVPNDAKLIFEYGFNLKQEIIIKKGDFPIIKFRTNRTVLNEIVVVGYGTQKKKSLEGSAQHLVEESNKPISFAAVENIDRNGNVIVNGKLLNKIQIRGNSVLQGKVAGVEITRINQNVIPQTPIITRKNFNETAFFYPQLKTNEKGEILINFTMPEALTKWRFKALAQTPDLKFAYFENEVITQKQVMISANMPRFLREGDTVTVSAIVANLNTKKVSVKTALQLFNAMNMQPVKLLADASEANQTIEIAANTNKPVSFKLIIPKGLDALTYRLTADAGKYSDGEENTLPVLPNAMLVTESVPMMVRPNQTKTFTMKKLLHNQSSTLQNKTLTLEYTENPAWYAVQALPYLMEFPYECSEQTFNRYFANSLATSLLKKLPVVQQVFERWKTSDSKELLSNLEK
ncbi:MAG: hypothetical protein EOP42_27195, partial [Sphingobacteriaceae bacterium]